MNPYLLKLQCLHALRLLEARTPLHEVIRLSRLSPVQVRILATVHARP